MEFDTLVLSGCGPSGIAYTGVFKALLERGILTKELNGINEIITTSIGILFSFAILLGLDNEAIREIVMRFDIGSMLDSESICIDSLLLECGLYETDGIRRIFQSLCKNIVGKPDMTLRELYECKPICLTVKVFNVTRKQTEYISYKNYPDLSIVTLAEMTTAIPIFFKPVSYNGSLYTDGGLRGSFPIERCQSPNYLGIYVVGGSADILAEVNEICPIVGFIYSLLGESDPRTYEIQRGIIDHRIIYLDVGLGLDFQVDDSTKTKVLQDVYQKTLQHIDEHLDKD